MTGVIQIPTNLLTDNNGASPRLRVDPGQTGFFAGRMFRNYAELSVPVGVTHHMRFTSPVDFILWTQELEIDNGGVKFQAFTGATPSGTWTDLSPIGVNRMASRPSPYYNAQARLSVGSGFGANTGTSTGGTEVDVLRLRTASQAVTASNVGVGNDSERGLPAGTYYFRFTPLTGVNDTSTGLYRLVWEERI